MTPGKIAPPRPEAAPATATWDDDDDCFRAGPVDDQGRRHGVWRAWYASGTVYGEDTYEAGVAHGLMWCERGAADETPFDDTFDARVHRLERGYDRGMWISDRCLTRDGRVVGSDGEPLPDRAEHIPATASYLAGNEAWVDGPMHGNVPITGRQRLWYRDGQPLADAEWRDGERHGKTLLFLHPGLRLDSELQGPSLTRVIDADYDSGVIRHVAFFARDGGEPLAAASFEDGALHGTLHWSVDRHMNYHEPAVVVGDLRVSCDELLDGRRLRGIFRIEADYERGALIATRAFDAAGELMLPPPPVTDYGQDMARSDIAGYIARGDLARDLAAWFPTRAASEFDDDAARAHDVFARLPEPHRATAAALDAIVRAGKFPVLITCNLTAYGFDCVKNDLYDLADARYFGLAYDPSGNMQFLDLDTGGVVGYEHEEGILSPDRAFDSLDEWAFCMIRVELAFDKRVPAGELRSLFERLGLGAGAFELGAAD